VLSHVYAGGGNAQILGIPVKLQNRGSETSLAGPRTTHNAEGPGCVSGQEYGALGSGREKLTKRRVCVLKVAQE